MLESHAFRSSLGNSANSHRRSAPGDVPRLRQKVVGRLTCAVACFVALVSFASVTSPAARADQIVVIEGRGFGHGVGMAQDGAYWLGRAGRDVTDILRTFYPGAVIARRGGAIRVPLGSGTTTLGFPSGGSIGDVRVAAGTTITVRPTSGGVIAERRSAPGNPSASEPNADVGASAESAIDSVVSHVGSGAIEDHAASAAKETIEFERIAAVRAQAPSADSATNDAGSASVATVVASASAPIPAPTLGAPDDVTTIAPTTIASVAPTLGLPETSTVSSVSSSAEPAAVASSVPTGGSPVDTAPNAATTTTTDVSPTDNAGSDVSDRDGGNDGRTRQTVVLAQGSVIEARGNGTVAMGGRRYRGVIEFRSGGNGMRIVNVVDVEDYLKGMGEILYRTWPAATLQAQAVAARTYALRMMATRGEVCPTQACQVYLGAQVEYPQMNSAVEATRGKVLVYKGKLIAAYYSASGGGTIATESEAFGSGVDSPYLRAGVYPTGDVLAWTVRMTLGEVARRVGYRGRPSGVAITKVGPSGRALEVTVSGSAGERRIGGPAFDKALGLKSTFFTIGQASGTLVPSALPASPLALPEAGGITLQGPIDAQGAIVGTNDPELAAIPPVSGFPAGLDTTPDSTSVLTTSAQPPTTTPPTTPERATSNPRNVSTKNSKRERRASATKRSSNDLLILALPFALLLAGSIAAIISNQKKNRSTPPQPKRPPPRRRPPTKP